MCGIAGRIGFSTSVQIDESVLSRMTSYLQERGPDNESFFIEKNVGLAHTRLSIIDLTEAGNQPMIHLGVVLVFNGEIYNFQSLRQELTSLGAKFDSHSDTEVIILGYRHWGIEILLSKLDGMFSFALFDQKLDQCILARDPFGKKPLYYFIDGSELLFASDIRSIWEVAKNKLELNHDALDYYLAEITCPQPHSIWKNVYQVKPSHFYTFSTKQAELKKNQYFKLAYDSSYAEISEFEAISLTEKLLTEAILKRTVADVEVGCFLSGGIDSGLVSAILASNTSKQIKTFTVGFDLEAYNEIPEAHVVSDRYETDHEDIILKPISMADVVALIEYYGEPFADSSAIPTYMISKAIGKHIKVALSGDGGDECFGGYPQYVLAHKANEFSIKYRNQLVQNVVTPVDKLISRFSPKIDNYGSFRDYNRWSGDQRLLRDIGFNYHERTQLLQIASNFTTTYLSEIWDEESEFLDPVNRLMRASFKTRLLNDYLVKVDRASMKNSLEVRSPFLDKQLVNLGINLPTKLLFKNGQSKYLLKKLAEKYIAPNVAARPKMGFGIPLAHWLRNEYNELIDAYLRTDVFKQRPFFDIKEVERILSEHKSHQKDHGNKIWSLLCFEIWCKKFLD